ncbi:hypothetical protein K7432_006994 [Basidiobolus ranarum]|uniref:Cation/H+ exchanger transmembrane domain-containing protein n=1 Tax=Basidiobolus ranarum TaxID=34480 RepID=A0ABR2WUC5_9FUNG
MLSLITISLYLFILYLSGKLFSLLYADLIGHLLVGIVLVAWKNMLPTFLVEVFTLIGKLGMLLLVFEGGMGIELSHVRGAFSQALLIALTGTLLPFGVGTLVCHFLFKFSLLEAVISSASLASTSIGIIIMLLSQQGITKTPFGVLITIAALLDDVFSLIILAVMKEIGPIMKGTHDTVQPWLIARPFVVSVGFILLAFGCFFGLKLAASSFTRNFPELSTLEKDTLPNTYPSSPTNTSNWADDKQHSYTYRLKVFLLSNGFLHRAILLLILVVGLVFSVLAEILGSSELLGAFVAGFIFAPYSLPNVLFHSHVHPIMTWTTPIFFSSIGFIVPVSSLFNPENFGNAAIYTLAMAITKFLAGMWVKPTIPDGVVVDIAMIARGEIGLVMASESVKNGMMGNSAFVVTVWAIIVCTFIAPLGVAWGLKFRQRNAT